MKTLGKLFKPAYLAARKENWLRIASTLPV
jgi:hypothetical protein